jgi:hypothetical protein
MRWNPLNGRGWGDGSVEGKKKGRRLAGWFAMFHRRDDEPNRLFRILPYAVIDHCWILEHLMSFSVLQVFGPVPNFDIL